MTLTDFLLARIAEDEETARLMGHIAGGFDRVLGPVGPARVLAECAAKRAIVEKLLDTRHEVVEDCWYTCAEATEDRDGGRCCDVNRRGTGCDCGRDAQVESYLRILALPYADHPDYRSEWTP